MTTIFLLFTEKFFALSRKDEGGDGDGVGELSTIKLFVLSRKFRKVEDGDGDGVGAGGNLEYTYPFFSKESKRAP
ncbi:hypothetical protein F8M41_022445 [Gigaspora margarita]|nr:hypothetical protein F8M41_022445 [Gigaspora margarita]